MARSKPRHHSGEPFRERILQDLLQLRDFRILEGHGRKSRSILASPSKKVMAPSSFCT